MTSMSQASSASLLAPSSPSSQSYPSTTLSPSSPTPPGSPATAAEALLDRARRLSSNAYERTRPLAFAEGEEIHHHNPHSHSHSRSSSNPSPTLSPTSIPSRHTYRGSFQDYIKRSSSSQRPVSSSSTKSASSFSLISGVPSAETADPLTNSTQQTTTTITTTTPTTETAEEFLSHDTNKANSTDEGKETHAPLVCPTSTSPSMTRHSLTITTTRPRALTLESIRETKENTNTTITATTSKDGESTTTAGTSMLSSPKDSHRKHKSENGVAGSGLVHGILEALRDGEQQQPQLQKRFSDLRQPLNSKNSMGLEEQELTSASAPPTTPSSVAATKATAQSSLVASTAAEGAPAPATVAAAAAAAAMVTGTPTIFREDAKEDAPTNQKASYSPYSTTDKGAGTAPSPHNLNAAVVAVSTDTLEQQQKLQELPSPPPKPLQDQQSERRSSVVSTATAFMRRGTRSDSVSSVPDNTEHNPIVSGMVTSSSPPLIHANVATLSSSNSTKPSKRTSKLFGKLVPKFLQTNNLNTTPSSSGPQSAYPASPSPLSAMTRPTRSASFAAGSSSPMATKSTTEDVAAEAARRTQLPALPSLSESVVRSNEDWLRLSDDQRSQRSVSTLSSVEEKRPERPAMSSRATSHLSNKSTKSMRSSAQETTMSSPTLATKETTICLNNSGINVKGDEQKDTQTTESKMNDGQNETQEQIRNGQGTRSPYIIDDEDCDDDFFLKSVLRKNNSTTRPQAPPMLETGWRSNGSYSNERTPSLSTSANSSSQTSSVSGSPTSPMPPMFTPSSTPVATSAPQHQFSSLQFDRQAAVRQQVVDEKRSRLHDAVGEWRRSSNRSSGSMSGGSSG